MAGGEGLNLLVAGMMILTIILSCDTQCAHDERKLCIYLPPRGHTSQACLACR